MLRKWLRAYTAHDDPATAMANFIAMVIGWNGPLYPFYVIAVAGWPIAPLAILTALAAPFFLAIPWIGRRSSRAGRLALPMFGVVNTIWCIKLLGTGCALSLFLLPCAILSALLYRRDERPLLLLAASAAFAAYFLPGRFFGRAIIPVPETAAAHLATVNEGSVMALAILVAWQLSILLRRLPSAVRTSAMSTWKEPIG